MLRHYLFHSTAACVKLAMGYGPSLKPGAAALMPYRPRSGKFGSFAMVSDNQGRSGTIRWSQEDDLKLIVLSARGLPHKEITRLLGRTSLTSVSDRLRHFRNKLSKEPQVNAETMLGQTVRGVADLTTIDFPPAQSSTKSIP